MLQVSELNLPPPETQFHVGLLSEVNIFPFTSIHPGLTFDVSLPRWRLASPSLNYQRRMDPNGKWRRTKEAPGRNLTLDMDNIGNWSNREETLIWRWMKATDQFLTMNL